MAKQHSLEEICRRLLNTALEDGLIKMNTGVCAPLDLSNSDVTNLANNLNSLLNGEDVSDTPKTITKRTINLARSPRLPFDTAEVVKHGGEISGKKVVEIELRSDDNLYIDGQIVELFLSERQKGDKTIKGCELRQELEDGDQVLLNSNVLDYLYYHPELFPKHWKKDEDGKTRYIFFWNSIFRAPSNGRLYVCCLYWSGGSLNRGCYWLACDWDCQYPSASVASN